MLRVQAHHGLVNHEHLRIVQQGRGDGYPLARAVGQALDRLVHIGFKIQSGHERPSLSFDARVVHLKKLAYEPEELPGRKFLVKEWEVRHISQARPCGEGLRLNVESAHAGGAGRRLHQTGENLQGRRLARRVGSQQREEFSGPHRQTDPGHGHQVAEFLHQVDQFDHSVAAFKAPANWSCIRTMPFGSSARRISPARLTKTLIPYRSNRRVSNR